MEKASITLLSDRPNNETRIVCEMLSQLNCEVRVLDSRSIDSTNHSTLNIVILFLKECHYSSSDFNLLRQHHETIRVLGLFEDVTDRKYKNLLAICNDTLLWPCHIRELSSRLQAYSNQLNHAASINLHKKNQVRIDEHPCFEYQKITGRSPAFLNVLDVIQKMASCDAPILIEGETGTGKEVAARSVHYLSSRQGYPFIPVNCGALPDSLLESELFGHERGAFTDAKTSRPGLIAQAQGGTLFLDEVDSLSPKAQVSLLRFLQDGSYRAVGGSKQVKANVRIVSANNRGLMKLCNEGKFRQDLYFRLNILSLKMPPLRMRRGDISLLASYFIKNYSHQYALAEKSIHPETLAWMESYHWPGNIRELENLLHREYLLAEGDCIKINNKVLMPSDDQEASALDLFKTVNISEKFANAKAKLIAEFEQHYLTRIMLETNGNVSVAAKRAGKERRAFSRLLKKYGISREQFLSTGS